MKKANSYKRMSMIPEGEEEHAGITERLQKPLNPVMSLITEEEGPLNSEQAERLQ